MGKVKVKIEPGLEPEPQERCYEELLQYLNPIARPLASRKLSKRLYRIIKKAVKQKNIRRGVKEVQKFLNKGEKGIVVLAGDTLPIEVYCHLPIMCEDRSMPYVYIPSKLERITKVYANLQRLMMKNHCYRDLGAAAGSKRPTCVILVKAHEDYQDAFDECLDAVQSLPMPL